MPEGIEYDRDIGFLVSSLTEGTINKVDDEGNIHPFVQSEDLISTVGLHIDHGRNWLLACNLNRSALRDGANTVPASLIVVDLNNGEIIRNVNLTGDAPRFLNDVVTDEEGNAYVTESLSGQVFKVTPAGEVSVFAFSPDWAPQNGAPVGINGIEYLPSGYLIVGVTPTGHLFKVPLESPQNYTQVAMEQVTAGADGLTFRPDGHLMVVGNGNVYDVKSTDDWDSAVLVQRYVTGYPNPTTCAIRDAQAYVSHAYFSDPQRQVYEIEMVQFRPTLIPVVAPGLLPEGLEYHPSTGFLVSSINTGTVHAVDDSGALTPFVQYGNLIGSLGLQVDEDRNRLLVVNLNSTAAFLDNFALSPFMAGLVVASLDTGEVIFETDLSNLGPEGVFRFANDVVNDKDGNAYVTDSFGGQIWKVTLQGEASIFASDARFFPQQGDLIGLNGIEYDPLGFLLVGRSDGVIFKVPIDDPNDVEEVQLDRLPVGADGIVIRPNGTMAVVGDGNVYLLQSEDHWKSASMIGIFETNIPSPTTAAVRYYAEDSVYVVHAHYGNFTRSVYEIQVVDFVHIVPPTTTEEPTTQTSQQPTSQTSQQPTSQSTQQTVTTDDTQSSESSTGEHTGSTEETSQENKTTQQDDSSSTILGLTLLPLFTACWFFV